MTNWVMPYIRKYRWRIVLSLLFALLGVASGAMLLFVSGYLISKASLRPENIMLVYVPIVSVRAFSIGQAVFPYIEKLISHDIVLRILAKYRDRLYKILEPQAMLLQTHFQTGDILTVLSDDIEKLQDLYIKTLLPSLTGVVIYTVFAIVVGFFDLGFMLMMLALLGIIIFLMPLLSYYLMVQKHVTIKDTRLQLYQHSTDTMFGQLDWLVSGRVEEAIDKVAKDNDSLMNEIEKVKRWHHLRDFLLHVVIGFVIIGMMVWSDKQTGLGTFSPTVIAAFVLMIFSITDALFPISSAIEDVPTYKESINRVEKLEANTPVQSSHQQWSLLSTPKLLVNSLYFRYEPEGKDIINGLSFAVEPGEKVAILGKSGSGKSTLLKLLAGVVEPTAGEVLMNDQTVQREALAKSIAVLNQKAHLFHTTIANNIRIGNPNATDEEVKEVLHQARILDHIESLPDGIHTQMEEMGKRFSGGERQRIAFARVLIQDTPIILLDEPTTGLDPITERQLLDMMITAATGKTIILVTHHLAGAEWMDNIIFLEHGRLKMKGSHTELMEINNYYRTLYEMDQGKIS